MDSTWDFALGLALGALVMFGVRALLRRILSARAVRAEEITIPPSLLAPIPTVVPAGPHPEAGPGGVPPAPRADPEVVGPVVVVPPAPVGSDPYPIAYAPPRDEEVHLSQRIVVHLFLLGRADPDDVGHPGSTQRGIGTALHADQSAVSKALRRLAAAGVVEVGRRHVRGGERRVNVYSLTRRGELLAREIRAHMPRPAPGAPRAP
jgi:DNA-binding MarR family transcriptional regulator